MLAGWQPPLSTAACTAGTRSRRTYDVAVRRRLCGGLDRLHDRLVPISGVRSLARDSIAAGIIAIGAYGAGMSFVVTALTVTVTAASAGLVGRYARQPPPDHDQAITLVLTGGYLAWYWWRDLPTAAIRPDHHHRRRRATRCCPPDPLRRRHARRGARAGDHRRRDHRRRPGADRPQPCTRLAARLHSRPAQPHPRPPRCQHHRTSRRPARGPHRRSGKPIDMMTSWLGAARPAGTAAAAVGGAWNSPTIHGHLCDVALASTRRPNQASDLPRRRRPLPPTALGDCSHDTSGVVCAALEASLQTSRRVDVPRVCATVRAQHRRGCDQQRLHQQLDLRRGDPDRGVGRS